MKGSTKKRGGTWTAYWYTTEKRNGERHQHSKGGFRIQRDAQAYLNSLLDDVAHGAWRPESRLTVGELLTDHWLPAKEAEGIARTTLSMYRRSCNNCIVPHLGGAEVSQLTPADVATLADTLRTSGRRDGTGGLAPRTVQLAVGNLKAATAWAAVDLLSRDPLGTYKRPKARSPVMKWWSVEEAQRFLLATTDDRMAFGWGLLLTRGVRRGELCGLRWENVDLEGRTVRIVRTRVMLDGRPIDSLPKTEASRRSIPLDPKLVALLRRHRAAQAAERLAAGEIYQDGGWLVADEAGRPYSPTSISQKFNRKRTTIGLRRIRFHDLRHTAATLMLAEGVPVKVVADLLGQDPRVTLATYAHAVPGLAEAAGAALSAKLLG